MNLKVPMSVTINHLIGTLVAYIMMFAILVLSLWGCKAGLHGLFGWF